MQTKKKEFKLNLASFDLLKGLMICQVVLMHTSFTVEWQGNPAIETYFAIVRSPAAIVLPAFFIISGYGFKTKGPLKMLKNSAAGMLMPCFWVLLSEMLLIPVCYGACYYISGRSLAEILPIWFSGVVGSVFGMPELEGYKIFGIEARFCGPIWFFWAMFTAQNVLNLVLHHLKKTWQQVGAILLCNILGYWLLKQEIYYFCIYSGLMSAVYCYVGYLLKKHKLLQKWVYDWQAWLGLAVLAALSLLMPLEGWLVPDGLLQPVGICCVSLLVIMASLLLGKFDWKCTDLFKTMGVYSYWILAIHSAETHWGPWAGFQYNLPLSKGALLTVITVSWFVIIAVCCVMLKKMSKYRYRKKLAQKGMAASR